MATVICDTINLSTETESPLRSSSYESGKVLLHDRMFIKGNYNNLKSTYETTQFVSLIEVNPEVKDNNIPAFFFAIGSLHIPLVRSQLLPNRTMKSFEPNALTLSCNDKEGNVKTLGLLFMDTRTFKKWHKTIRQALCDILLSKALYPKKHGCSINVDLIKRAMSQCSTFASKRDTSLLSRAKRLCSLKPKLHDIACRLRSTSIETVISDIEGLNLDLIKGVSKDDPLLAIDDEVQYILAQFLEYVSRGDNKENVSETSNDQFLASSPSDKGKKTVTFSAVNQVLQIASWSQDNPMVKKSTGGTPTRILQQIRSAYSNFQGTPPSKESIATSSAAASPLIMTPAPRETVKSSGNRISTTLKSKSPYLARSPLQNITNKQSIISPLPPVLTVLQAIRNRPNVPASSDDQIIPTPLPVYHRLSSPEKSLIDQCYAFIDERGDEGYILFSRRSLIYWPFLLGVAVLFSTILCQNMSSSNFITSSSSLASASQSFQDDKFVMYGMKLLEVEELKNILQRKMQEVGMFEKTIIGLGGLLPPINHKKQKQDTFKASPLLNLEVASLRATEKHGMFKSDPNVGKVWQRRIKFFFNFLSHIVGVLRTFVDGFLSALRQA